MVLTVTSIEEITEGVQSEISKEQLEDYLKKMPEVNLSALDRLHESMMEVAGDKFALAAMHRERVEAFVRQLALITGGMTTLANLLGITDESGKVIPAAQHDFVVWDASRLKYILAHAAAQIDTIHMKRETAESLLQEANRRREEDQKRIKLLEERSTNETNVSGEKLKTSQDSVHLLNTILASYQDQDTYAVVRMDPVTREIEKYVVESPDTIRFTPTLAQATPCSSMREARQLRLRVLTALRNKAKRVDRMTLSERLGIVRLAVSVVDLTKEYESDE